MNKVFVDSINGKMARLIYDNAEFTVPMTLLPKAIKEGDTLTVSFNIDAKETEKAKKECEDLLNMLLEKNSK